jgi:addiction module HigA family antidote
MSRVNPQARRRPTHPGEVLREEFLVPKRWTQARAAERMAMPAKRLSAILCGRRGVTADGALRFAKLTKTTPQFWMQLQNAVDLYDCVRRNSRDGRS